MCTTKRIFLTGRPLRLVVAVGLASASGSANGSALTSKNAKIATIAKSRIEHVLLMMKFCCVFHVNQNNSL